MDNDSIAQFLDLVFQDSAVLAASIIAVFIVALTILQSFIREE